MTPPADYGPVPVSRIKAEATAIFDALARGRRVLVSKHGRVVAAIDPPRAVPPELLVDYVTPGEPVLDELTAQVINQGSPSAAVTASVEGSPHYVTKDSRVYGLLRGITEDDLAVQLPTREQVSERGRRVQEFLHGHPDADAEQVAALVEVVNRELGIPQADSTPQTASLLRVQDDDRLRTYIQSIAHAYAEQAGTLVGQSGAADAADRASLVRTIEARTIEAVARLTEATLSADASRAMKAHAVTKKTVAIAETRADEALARLKSGSPTIEIPVGKYDPGAKGSSSRDVSEQVTNLAARAKELEDRAAAAKGKAKADLEHEVEAARQSAQVQGEGLRQSAEADKGKLSAWWDSVQRSWNEHLAAVRKDVDDERSAHDLKAAQRIADRAEDDAVFAVDYAYAAIEEAEYAVLDATLARMEADEMAARAGTGSG
jgi:hypothetical protein